MSRNQRLGLIAGAIIVVVVAFVLISPNKDDKKKPASNQSQNSSQTKSAVQAKPKPPEVTVRDGRPVGGVKTVEFTSGQTARIDVTSNKSGEIHLHGYDIEKEVRPGKTTVLSFKAKIEGIFALEDHASDAELAKVRVNPK